MDLTFDGVAGEILALKAKFKIPLTEKMSTTVTGKSAVVRIKVPALSVADEFDTQIDKVKEAFLAAQVLQEWYQRALK
jgi:hypothetical protein